MLILKNIRKSEKNREIKNLEKEEKKETILRRFLASYHFSSEIEREMAYNDLSLLLLLNPELVRNTSKEIARKAEEYENNNLFLDIVEAEYRFALGIALMEGNESGVKDYLAKFNKMREKRGKERMFEWISQNPQKAIDFARAFYEWRRGQQIESKRY